MAMPGKTRLPILIVGGGIGGLATALALARGGLAAHVIEKAAEFTEIGAGLQLAPNATAVLDRLGVLDEVRSHAVHPSRLVWMDAITGAPLTAIDLGAAFLRRYRYPYIVMHRADLLAVLLAACRGEARITLAPRKELVEVRDDGASAGARTADGDVYDCDLLIGADGLHSTVRALVATDVPIADGFVAYRGTVPMSHVSQHADLDNVMMWVGPDLHFVQYPVRHGDLFNQVAVFRSPSFRPDNDDWGGPEELDAHYAQTCAAVRDAAAMIGRDRHWTMLDRKPIGRWTRNRIALLGDAAHPMYQYIAQGACQAIEDAASLADCVAAASGDVEAGLRAYEKARVLRTARVQLTARAMGAFFHLDGVAAQVRNAMVATRASDDYAMLDWLYGHRA
jgi:3-hydroxybenzoate 6-monooxygenase